LVGDEVVDVVAALPPSDGKAAAKVGNKHANKCVNDENMCYRSVAGIMGGKHDLMLVHS
jgi:hypothetical protein